MSIWDEMTPEQFEAATKLAGLADKNELLKEQMAQAMALRNPRKGYGLWGGLTNGLADAADKVFAGLNAHEAKAEMEKNMAEQGQTRGVLGGLFRERRPRPAPGNGTPLGPDDFFQT